jgi:two-component system OmpR family response regulator
MSEELKRVLLVEDDPSILTVARMSLELVGGLEVRACSSGQEALDAVSEFRPQLVLLDVMMPGMDGPTVLARLRANQDTAALPVIFLTAKVLAEEIERLRALGALDILAKPFDPMKLAEQVRAVWARAGL